MVVKEYLPASLLVKFMVRIFLNLPRKNLNERSLLQFNAAEMGFRLVSGLVCCVRIDKTCSCTRKVLLKPAYYRLMDNNKTLSLGVQ